MYHLLWSLYLFTALQLPAQAIKVTVPAAGAKYALNPGSSAIEWQQESGDPSECDIWLQHIGGEATYFAHVAVKSCRFDFSSWSNLATNETTPAPTVGAYCFTFTATNTTEEDGGFLTESGDFFIEDGSGSKGLSSGTKAGIGVGVAVAVFAILAVLYYLVRKRKRRNTQQAQEHVPFSKPELEANTATGLPRAMGASELSTTVGQSELSDIMGKSELSTKVESVPPLELPAKDDFVYELPANSGLPDKHAKM